MFKSGVKQLLYAKVMAALTRLKPEQIIYVACDPAALARELKVAVSHAYQITSLQPYDLSPTPTILKA